MNIRPPNNVPSRNPQLAAARDTVDPSWRAETGPLAEDVPLCTGGGMVFAVGRDDTLTVLDAKSGEVAWQRPLHGRLVGRPIACDDVLVISSATEGETLSVSSPCVLSALEAKSGRLLWEKTVRSGTSSPVRAHDVIAVRDGDFVVSGLNTADGSERWHKGMNFIQGIQPTAGEDGTVYVYDHPYAKAFSPTNGHMTMEVIPNDDFPVGTSKGGHCIVPPTVARSVASPSTVSITEKMKLEAGAWRPTTDKETTARDMGLAGYTCDIRDRQAVCLDRTGAMVAHSAAFAAIPASACVSAAGIVHVADAGGTIYTFDFQDAMQRNLTAKTTPTTGQVARQDDAVIINGVRLPVRKSD